MHATTLDWSTSTMVLRSSHTSTPCEPALARHWELAVQNPSCITHEIFCSMLKHHPPLRVVQSLLTLNREVAVCPPNESTSALHVAVQSKCELPVVACLLEAWPEALQRKAPCGRNQVRMDPLMYAKLYRRRDSELMQLLSTAIRPRDRKHGSVTLNKPCQSSSQYTALQENSFETTKPVTEKSNTTETNRSVSSSDSGTLAPVKLFTAEAFEDGIGRCEASDVLNDSESRLGSKPVYSHPVITPGVDKKTVMDRMQQAIHASMSYEQGLADLKNTCLVALKGHQRLVERVKKLEDRAIVEPCCSQIEEGKETWCSELMTSIEMQVHHQLSEQSRTLEMIVERLEQNVSSSHKDTRSQLQLMQNRISQTELMMLYMQQQVEGRFPEMQRKPQKRMGMTKSILVNKIEDDARPLLQAGGSPEMYKKYHPLGNKYGIAKKVRFLICQI